LLAATLCGCARKPRGYAGYAFVANQEGRSVAVVNLRRFTLMRQIPLDAAPSAVIANPARPAVYVLTPENGTISEIEAQPPALKRRVRPAQNAIAMRLSGDGRSIWVLGREPRALIRISLETFRAAERIPLPHEPANFELDARSEGKMAAVSFPSVKSAALFELAPKPVAAAIPFPAETRIVGFRSDGRQLLLASGVDRSMTMVDVATGKTVVKLPLPLEPANFCFLADGGQLFVTGPGMDAVVIVSPYSTEIGETILAGRAPAQMAVLKSPQYLFVSNPESGDVTVLDIETRKLVVVVHAGAEPRQILFTPDNQYALVLNRGSGDLAVIRVAGFTTGPNSEWAQRHKHGGLFTVLPVGARPVSAAVVGV